MNKKLFLYLSLIAVLFILGVSYFKVGQLNVKASPESFNMPTWTENEEIPFANKHMQIVFTDENGKTVTEFKTGGNGEWKSEILVSPIPSEVGIVTIWDTKKIMTFYPEEKLLSINKEFDSNAKVMPNKLLSQVLKNEVKRKNKETKEDENFDFYSEDRTIQLIDEESSIDKTMKKDVKIKVKYKVNKKKDRLEKLETYDINNQLLSTTEVTFSKEGIEFDSSEFTFDESKADYIQ